MNGPSPIENIMSRQALPQMPERLKRFARQSAPESATKHSPAPGEQPTAGTNTSVTGPAAEFAKLFPGLADKNAAGGEAYRDGRVASGQVDRGADIQREIAADHERKQLYESAVEFQSLFVKMMLNAMRKTLNKDNDPLYGGQTQEIFEDMLYDQYALSLSKGGGFPLADWVYRDLTRNLPPAGRSQGPTPTMQRGVREYDINLPAHPPSVSSDRIKTRPNGL